MREGRLGKMVGSVSWESPPGSAQRGKVATVGDAEIEIIDLFTHEQYFWPFYKSYVPDHAQRLDAAIRWVTEHGYKPVFFHEGLLGAPA